MKKSQTSSEPKPYLARASYAGFGLAALGLLLFAILALNVHDNGPLTAWDEPLIQAIHAGALQDSWLGRDAMIFAGTIGRETALVITVVLAGYWLVKRNWRPFSMLMAGVAGVEIWFEILPRLRSWRWRLFAFIDFVLIVLVVGWSRLYVGDHYPTDVLGGYAFGLFWASLIYTIFELDYSRSRALREVRQGVSSKVS